MAAWNFAVLVDTIAREVPDREAIAHGTRRVTWRQLATRARSFAWHLHEETGLASGANVAILLPNCPEYIETFVAARKLRCSPLNVVPGSSTDILHQAIDASDAKLVVCAAASAHVARDAARRIPKQWRPAIVEIGEPYDRMIAAARPPVEWDLEIPTADDLIHLATRDVNADDPGNTLLAVPSLAAGNGLAAALGALSRKGRIVFVDSAAFDAQVVWRTVQSERVATLTIAGDTHARPLLAALPTATDGRSLPSLRAIWSSGARLSPDAAQSLEAALPGVTVLDAFDDDGTELRQPSATPMIRSSDVEARLGKHKSIADSVVIGVSDPRVGKLVVAVVQVADGHYLDTPELAAWCRAHLPTAMTPGRFVLVDSIERSPSGAPDYETLRRVAIERLMGEG